MLWEDMHSCLFIPLVIALAGCVTTNPSTPPELQISHEGEVPAYLTASQSCALIVGGTGSSFVDQNLGKVWYEANRQIAGYLYEIFSNEGYQVKRFVVPQGSPSNEVLSSVALALAQSKCNTFIQVAHEVNEDRDGQYFQYSVSVMHVEVKKDNPRSSSGTNVTTAGDYNRSYRYARTAYNLETFRTGTFANRAYDDLKTSGALARIVRGG